MSDTVKVEEWRPIVGWEHLYSISNLGRIRSLDKRVACGHGGTALRRGRIIKPVLKGGRYLVVTLADGDIRQQFFVHDLVLLMFKGVKPEGYQSCHNDGNKANNAAENLRYDTPKNNTLDKIEHGTLRRGETHGMVKLTIEQVLEIRKSTGFKGIDLADQYGISPSQISSIRKYKTWKHI